MISVIIPTLNAERDLGATLSALVPATVEGIVREVLVVDGGSQDATLQICEDAGVKLLSGARGRGQQLAKGGAAARGPWLLFLHADTRLEPSWSVDAEQFIARHTNQIKAAGAFRFALADKGIRPRILEILVRLRCQLFKLPYGDQGLLIEKGFYEELGGFSAFPVMEDVEIVRRIGAKRIHNLPSDAQTSAIRYETGGYIRRAAGNLACLALYFAGVPPTDLLKRYDPESLDLSNPPHESDGLKKDKQSSKSANEGSNARS